MMQQRCEAFGADGQGNADDDLVKAMADAKHDHQQRHRHAADAAGEETQPK